MSQLGLGVMIHYLSGGTEHSASEYYGKTINDAKLEDNKLFLTFVDGKKIAIWDNGQSCCENRYMSTDDDLSSLVGNTLTRIEEKPGPSKDEEYDVHETCFLEIGTNLGSITMVNHNEHNGYYGGFGLTITEEN